MRKQRVCWNCNGTYHRCNSIGLWTTRNPGHRAGWQKEVSKFCMKCQSVQESKHMVKLAGVKFMVVVKKAVKNVNKKYSNAVRIAA